ncbi:hypothetical protein yc1106_09871 [Curvularia clavata]|uniref:Uncharacterized protein n=1 Tax=Curvularia clavata TaxID=95742 RepID=A0A9Q9DX61_CURCL|nr:hypothetical protein yc1106_09871 [Curvularia clavata]
MHAGSPVYACNVTDVDSYCCYDDCKCDSPFEVFSFPEPPSAVSTKTIILEKFTPNPSAPTSKTSKSSATLPASASTSPTGSSSGAQSLTSNEGSQNYLALGIGLGLGLGLGIPLIFLAGFCIWRRKQASNQPTNSTLKSLDYNNEDFYPLQSKHEYAHEAPRTPREQAPVTEIPPAEKDLAIQQLVELPDRQSKTLTALPAQAGSEKKF